MRVYLVADRYGRAGLAAGLLPMAVGWAEVATLAGPTRAALAELARQK